MPTPHDWKFLGSHVRVASGYSRDTWEDTWEQCAGCGAVKHDYSFGGRQKSPNYPRYFRFGLQTALVEDYCTREVDGTERNVPGVDMNGAA